jgi:hypothetical protein
MCKAVQALLGGLVDQVVPGFPCWLASQDAVQMMEAYLQQEGQVDLHHCQLFLFLSQNI